MCVRVCVWLSVQDSAHVHTCALSALACVLILSIFVFLAVPWFSDMHVRVCACVRRAKCARIWLQSVLAISQKHFVSLALVRGGLLIIIAQLLSHTCGGYCRARACTGIIAPKTIIFSSWCVWGVEIKLIWIGLNDKQWCRFGSHRFVRIQICLAPAIMMHLKAITRSFRQCKQILKPSIWENALSDIIRTYDFKVELYGTFSTRRVCSTTKSYSHSVSYANIPQRSNGLKMRAHIRNKWFEERKNANVQTLILVRNCSYARSLAPLQKPG